MNDVILNMEIPDEVKERLMSVKGDMGYSELFNYLLGVLDMAESYSKGEMKAELQARKWLAMGHDAKITVTELRKFTGVRSQVAEKVTVKLKVEIEKFNSQF